MICTGDYGEKIKNLRMRLGLSQDRFGKKLGLAGKTISAYETGRCVPTLKILEKIAETYDSTFLHLNDKKREQLEQRLRTIKSMLYELENSLLE
jgi:transcriptional regulator with XRE-family HTH domain